ncbi:nucleoside-diphosphate kinase [Actinokineospora sp.]|uniref:nucleoside-diphosphate kinase n=1 Tax=Actinokineospora sp. TaxID=1872133 RepID=UPI004037D765
MTPPTWATCLPDKARLFTEDTYFAETWSDAEHLLGDRLRDYCTRHTFLVVKPEALLTGRLTGVLDWLEDDQWDVVAARRMPLCRHTLRGLWRYHWNAVTRQHKDVVDLLFRQSDSLVLLLRSTAADEDGATRRLAAGKGPANPDNRLAGQLRARLGAPNAYLNCVHSPDEAADFLRELGVLFAADTRTSLLRDDLPVMPRHQVVSTVRTVESTSCGLGLADAVRYLAARCGRSGGAAIAEEIRAAGADGWDGDWRDVRSALSEVDPELAESFPFMVFATYLTTAEVPGRTRRLPTIRAAR